jgi:hypothetical protein
VSRPTPPQRLSPDNNGFARYLPLAPNHPLVGHVCKLCGEAFRSKDELTRIASPLATGWAHLPCALETRGRHE